MYMRGIVSVLLLIPFLFCSCGRKQPPRQETPEQQVRIHRDRSPRTPAQMQVSLEPEDAMEL